jgi:pseudouridine-5'-phosphate glycosidase
MKLTLSDEVKSALASGRPVVALETSVVAQGLPSPLNRETAEACEAAVRSEGAVPAATAVIDGEVRVGLSKADLERLASGERGLMKLGSRDLPAAVASNRTGGTTVSATCEIAAAAGIRVFATGGIGGVHRGVEKHWDISQDLWALSRFPVAVVCAGAKSVLDLAKTLEALESLAVPVVGVGTRELPSFYSVDSGHPLEHEVPDEHAGARWLAARYGALAQKGGVLFTVPVPKENAIARTEVEGWISQALEQAERENIRGKDVTPFLLKSLSAASGGRTLKANIALLVNNARFAGRLARAYAALKSA